MEQCPKIDRKVALAAVSRSTVQSDDEALSHRETLTNDKALSSRSGAPSNAGKHWATVKHCLMSIGTVQQLSTV